MQIERVHRHAPRVLHSHCEHSRAHALELTRAGRSFVGEVITNEPKPRACSSIRGVIFVVKERNKEDMGQLSTETRAKVVLQKTKGVHVQQIVQHPEYAGYDFSQIVHYRDLPLDRELVRNQAFTNI